MDLNPDTLLERLSKLSQGELETEQDALRASGKVDPDLDGVYSAFLEDKVSKWLEGAQQTPVSELAKDVIQGERRGTYSRAFIDEVAIPELARLRKQEESKNIVAEATKGVLSEPTQAASAFFEGVKQIGAGVVDAVAVPIITAGSLLESNPQVRQEMQSRAGARAAIGIESGIQQTLQPLSRFAQWALRGDSALERKAAEVASNITGGMTAQVGAEKEALDKGDVYSWWSTYSAPHRKMIETLEGEGELAKVIGVDKEYLKNTYGITLEVEDLEAGKSIGNAISVGVEALVPFEAGISIGAKAASRLGSAAKARVVLKGANASGLDKAIARVSDVSDKAIRKVMGAPAPATVLAKGLETKTDEVARIAAETAKYQSKLRDARMKMGAATVELGNLIRQQAAKQGVGTGSGVALAGLALASGADPQEALAAGVAGYLGRRVLGGRFGAQLVGAGIERAGKAMQFAMPGEGIRRALIDFSRDYKPIRTTLVGAGVGMAGALPWALSAESAEEAEGYLASGAGFGAAGAAAGRFRDYGAREILKRRAAGAEQAVGPFQPTANLGLETGLDAANAEAENLLSQNGLSVAQQGRQISRAIGGDSVYFSTRQRMAQELARVTNNNPAYAGAENAQGVFVPAEDNITGKPLVFSTVGADGRSTGHELFHLLAAHIESTDAGKKAMDDARSRAAKIFGASFEGGQIKSVPNELRQFAIFYNRGGLVEGSAQVALAPGANLNDPRVRRFWRNKLDEVLAEHGNVAFNRLPPGRLGGSREVSTALSRAFDTLVDRVAGIPRAGFQPNSPVVSSEALYVQPDFDLVTLLENGLYGSALELNDTIPDNSFEAAGAATPVQAPAAQQAAPTPQAPAPAAPAAPAPGTVDVGVLKPVPTSLTTDKSLGTTTPPQQPTVEPEVVAPVVEQAPVGVTPAGAVRGTEVQAARTNFEAPLTEGEKAEVAKLQPNPEGRPAVERVLSFLKALGGQKVGVPIAEVTYRGTSEGDGTARSKRVAVYGREGSTFLGFDIDRVNYNADLLFQWARENNKTLPYTGVDDPNFVRDVQTYVRNHAEGRRGSGEPLFIEGRPSTASGEPVAKLTREQEQFISIAMGQEAKAVATPRNVAALGRQAATARASGIEPLPFGEGSIEPNALRDRLRREGAPIAQIGADPDPVRRQANPNDRNSALMRMAARGILDFKLTGQSTSIPNQLAFEASFMPAETNRPEPFDSGPIGSGWMKPDGGFEWATSIASHDDLAKKLGFKNIEDAQQRGKLIRSWADRDDRIITVGVDEFSELSTAQQRELENIAIENRGAIRDDRGNVVIDYRDSDVQFMPAKLADFERENVQTVLNKDGWAIFTAENPNGTQGTAEENARRNAELEADLKAQGLEYAPVKGSYGRPENSFIVLDPSLTIDKAAELARKYEQETVFTKHGLVYQDGSINPARGIQVFDTAPADGYTEYNGGFFSGVIDFNTKLAPDSPEGQSLRAEEALSRAVEKPSEGPQFMPAAPIESEEFKTWFGDWTDPAAWSSKRKAPTSFVIETVNGKTVPKKVYHGTNADFRAFRSSGKGPVNYGLLGTYDVERTGIFFAENPEFASEFAASRGDVGARVIPAYLSIKSPADFSTPDAAYDTLQDVGLNGRMALQAGFQPWELFDGEQGKEIVAKLKEAGYDGATFSESIEDGYGSTNVWVAFDPEQVKSAISPTFDPENPAQFMPAKLANEKVKGQEVQFKTKAKKGSKGGVVDVVHFSSRDLTEIDPKKSFGKGAATATDLQGEPKVFFYVKGTSYEAPIAVRPNVYAAQIDGNALYDYNEDALGVRGIVNREKRDAAIRKAGFVGYYVETDGFDAVALFEKTKVVPTLAEDVMNRRQLVDTGRAKATKADLRRFAAEEKRIAREEAKATRSREQVEAEVRKSPEFQDAYRRLVESDRYVEGSFFFDEEMNNWVESQVERRLQSGVQFMPAASDVVARYLEQPEARGGLYVSSDLARPLISGYDPTRPGEFQKAASEVADAVFEGQLQNPAVEQVVFTAGGPGSGKTTATALLDLEEAGILTFDSVLGTEASAARDVQKALDTGKPVTVAFVYRPFEAATQGVIDRTGRENRTVPLSRIASSHRSAMSTFLALAEKFGDEVAFVVVDNSGSRQDAKVVADPVGFVQGKLNQTPDYETLKNIGKRIGEASREKLGSLADTFLETDQPARRKDGGVDSSQQVAYLPAASKEDARAQGDFLRGKAKEAGFDRVEDAPTEDIIRWASEWRENQNVGDALEQGGQFMPADNEETVLPEGVRFMPAAPGINLEDYVGKKMFALTTDRMGIGKIQTGRGAGRQTLEGEAQGGRGFPLLFDGRGWAFSTRSAAGSFMTRVKEAAGDAETVLVAMTTLNPTNHLKSRYGQAALVQTLQNAVNSGGVRLKALDKHLKEATLRASKLKSDLTQDSRLRIKNVRSLEDLKSVVSAGGFSFAEMQVLMDTLDFKRGSPIPFEKRQELGIDISSIAKDLADPEIFDLPDATVVSVIEIPKDQVAEKEELHSSYPWTVKGRLVGFLNVPMRLSRLTTNPKVFQGQGEKRRMTGHQLMTVMPSLDVLERGDLQALSEAKVRRLKDNEPSS